MQLTHKRVHLYAAKKDVQDVLKAAGVSADDADLTVMMSKLEGKSIPELIAEGKKDLASMPAGGAAPAGGATAAAGGDEPKAKAKKEEEPEEDVDMGDLFGGGDDDY